MNRILASCIIAFAVIVSACSADNDTPLPTVVSVATPHGTAVPVPTTSPDTGTTDSAPSDADAPETETTGSVKIIDSSKGYSSRIVLGGRDAWERFTAYMVCASAEDDAKVTRLTVESGTDAGLRMNNADLVAVGVRLGPDLIGVGILPPGGTGTVSIPLVKPIWAPKGGACTPFDLIAQIAPVQAWSTTPSPDACHSGDAPALGLASDPTDPAKLDVDAVSPSGKKLVAWANEFLHHGQPMAIRQSQLAIKLESLSSTTLVSGDMQIIKFQLSADVGGSVGVGQILLDITSTAGVKLCNFHVLRGATDMTDVSIVGTSKYADLTKSCLSASDQAAVLFKKEQVVDAGTSGSIYTIAATVSGAVSGSKVVIKFVQTTDLITNDLGCGGPGIIGTFYFPTVPGVMWSDRSEVPHTYGNVADPCPGSKDWTGNYLLKDLTGSVTLTL